MDYKSAFGNSFDDVLNRSSNAAVDRSSSSFYTINPSLPRNNSGRLALQSSVHSDVRAGLPRRFTMNEVPTLPGLSPIGQQRRQAAEPGHRDLSFVINGNHPSRDDKKQAEREFLLRKRLEFERNIELLDRKLDNYEAGPTNHSEPATPPELRDNGFPSSLSRPNRYSASNLTLYSPPGISNRSSRSGSQAMSPPTERARAYQALTSRMGGVDQDDSYETEVLNYNHRSAASLNRHSMPVTRRDPGARNGMADIGTVLGDHLNTTSFLFSDEDEKPSVSKASSTRPVTSFFTSTIEDKFPILVRREGDGHLQQVTSPEVVDLAAPPSPDPEANGWPSFARQLPSQTATSLAQSNSNNRSIGDSPPYGLPYPASSGQMTSTKPVTTNRHSMGAKISYAETQRPVFMTTPPNEVVEDANQSQPKLQSSYSTNDIPTIKSTDTVNGATTGSQINPSTQVNFTAEQRFHNHNASLGRIPPSVVNSNRHSRELSGPDGKVIEQNNVFQTLQSVMQGNAATFGTGQPSVLPESLATSATTHVGLPTFGNQAYYGGYGMRNGTPANIPLLNAAMSNLQLGGIQPQWNSSMQTYQQQYASYSPYQQYGPGLRLADSQARVIQQRRTQGAEDGARFANIALESLQGEIYTLCKDQHGCRYLQKKLEDRRPEHIQMIFAETHEHMVELMTDPFGNYLCQKLLEYANNDQRTTLINSAAPHMVKIALNQHGTRALQKMIEFVSTPEQIHTVIQALKHNVVSMIQDLNGNHVIQKCLNKLSSEHAQFIFDAVAANCVVVGTHRHGCCVIQRCIDHASGDQKAQLVAAVINCSFPLVQDPFGNYVLQYILDQGEESFSQPLCRTFLGNVVMLSKQKFSSNVIEKCLRIADADTKHKMIDELLRSTDFERLVDDAFANYVIQTAWDYASSDDEALLADRIRPVLPRLRHKPYGRRIQTRVQDRDKRLGIDANGQLTPTDTSSLDPVPIQDSHLISPPHRQLAGATPNVVMSPPSSFGGMNSGSTQLNYGIPSNLNLIQPNHLGNTSMANFSQYHGQMQVPLQQVFHYGHPAQQGMNYY